MSIYVANWDLGSGGYWGSGLKLTAGIWDISLCSQHIISVTAIFHAGIKPPFFPPLPFSLLFFPLVPSDLQTDCMTERVPQGGELPLIQIFCKWFVLFLSRCSHLIELCCRSQKQLLFLPFSFMSVAYHYLLVEVFAIVSRSVTMRAAWCYRGARQRRGLILDPFHLLLFPS